VVVVPLAKALGLAGDAFIYLANSDGSVGPKLKIGSGGVHEDVPRVGNGDGTYSTLLGDPNNDEHVIIAGLRCARILFYNRVPDGWVSSTWCSFPSLTTLMALMPPGS
jgi:hypothetical protein